MSQFTQSQRQAAKCLATTWETGSPRGKSGHLVVLADGGGITYGKLQTTENSGGLYLMLTKYRELNGIFAEALEPYREQLYRDKRSGEVGGTKNVLTKNKEFRALLQKAAAEDPLMSGFGQAQDQFFEEWFFAPALDICTHFGLTLPRSLAAVFDFCIQSGPGDQYNDGRARDRLQEWHNTYPGLEEEDATSDPTLREKAWSIYMLEQRHAFLGSGSHAWSRYRTKSMLEMMANDQWALEAPFTFTFFKQEFLKYPDKEITITEIDLAATYVT